MMHEHLTVIDALKRGHARRAERLMVTHIRHAREMILSARLA
jgi:DNA-binding GntR family transcriptional regulator